MSIQKVVTFKSCCHLKLDSVFLFQPIKGRTIRNLIGGRGRITKKSSCKGKLNEKNSCMPSNPKKYSCTGLKKSYKRNANEKILSAAQKFPTHPPPHDFSDGPFPTRYVLIRLLIQFHWICSLFSLTSFASYWCPHQIPRKTKLFLEIRW